MKKWLLRLALAIFLLVLGPATFLHLPGEIYPEIINGGIEKPEGQDFALDPQEIPPVREMMPGTFKFTVGLSNDEIGYIIPKSQWDADPPFTFGLHEAPYGEINSVGPETGPLVYRMMKEVLEEVKGSFPPVQNNPPDPFRLDQKPIMPKIRG